MEEDKNVDATSKITEVWNLITRYIHLNDIILLADLNNSRLK